MITFLFYFFIFLYSKCFPLHDLPAEYLYPEFLKSFENRYSVSRRKFNKVVCTHTETCRNRFKYYSTCDVCRITFAPFCTHFVFVFSMFYALTYPERVLNSNFFSSFSNSNYYDTYWNHDVNDSRYGFFFFCSRCCPYGTEHGRIAWNGTLERNKMFNRFLLFIQYDNNSRSDEVRPRKCLKSDTHRQSNCLSSYSQVFATIQRWFSNTFIDRFRREKASFPFPAAHDKRVT